MRRLHASVAPVAEAGDPAGYDARDLGSAVYMGHWLDAATKYVEKAREALSARPTWLFSSGPIGDPPRPTKRRPSTSMISMSKTHARGHKLFAGKLDKAGLGFGERAVMLAFHAAEGDYRDWDEVATWARDIAQEFGGDDGLWPHGGTAERMQQSICTGCRSAPADTPCGSTASSTRPQRHSSGIDQCATSITRRSRCESPRSLRDRTGAGAGWPRRQTRGVVAEGSVGSRSAGACGFFAMSCAAGATVSYPTSRTPSRAHNY